MTAASEVSGRSDLIASMRRSMTAARRTLWAWKKSTMVSRRARCAAGKRRPSLEERGEDFGLLVAKPVENLREIGLERERETVRDPHAVLDQVTARLDEAPEGAHVRALAAKRLELLAVTPQELQGDRRVGRVVLGATRE